MTDFAKIGKSNVSRAKCHERRIAKWLTEWSGTEFRRRRVEGRDTATTMVEGTADVIPISGQFMYSIEAKWRVDFSMDHLLASPHTAQFTQWWHQTCYDAQLATNQALDGRGDGRTIYPMLFFKPAPTLNWVAFSLRTMSLLRPQGNHSYDGSLWFPHLLYVDYSRVGEIAGDISHTKNKKNKKIVKLLLDNVIFCRWVDFAANVDSHSCFY